jgi:hypothetical protein
MGENQQAFCGDEIIDRNVLLGLALVAKANGHSIVEELNIALSSYVSENLPTAFAERDASLTAGSSAFNLFSR